MSLCRNVLGAMLLGLSLGWVFRPQSIDAIMGVALFLMLFPQMLEVDFAGLQRVFRAPWLVVIALVLNFLVSPLLIFVLLQLFMGNSGLHLMPGILLYGAVPGGGMAPAFTGMLRGNVSLSVTISAIGSILSLGMVPLWAKWLLGTTMDVPTALMCKHLCVILAIPLMVAVLTRRIVVGRMGESRFCLVKERIKSLSGVGLCVAVAAMSALYGNRVFNEPLVVPRIAGTVSTFLILLMIISWLFGKAFRCGHEDSTALILSTAAKNNAIALALAYTTFGPDAALANAIAGPLVQLPILSCFVAFRRRSFLLKSEFT
ncbi:MAG: bile acid:sodium symporter [Thermodesulfobacteriota bacterium]